MSREKATTAASPTEPAPTAETKLLPSLLPRRPLMAKPARGSAAMIQRGSVTRRRPCRSPFEEVDPVHVDRFLVAEEGHEDRQADRRLGGRDRDDEEDDDLALEGPERRAVADQGQVRGVHHHLDREEDRDRAAPQERARQPDREERSRGEEHVSEGNGSDHDADSRRASTKAPTRAARRSTDSASKWSR